MVKMNFSFFVIWIVMLTFFHYHSTLVWATQQSFLADKHNSASIACEDCHKESPPKEQVPTAICNKCHGELAKIAERTKKVIPNPHESHLGNVKCELCHHAHKPSEDYCSNCHEFEYKVP
jgi:hypothetical protein